MIIFIFKHQVEQLSETTGEESILLTASMSDGTLSHLVSESGKSFLDGHDEDYIQTPGGAAVRDDW